MQNKKRQWLVKNQKSLFHRIIGNKLVRKRELCTRFNPKLFHSAPLLGQKKMASIVAWRDEFNAHMDFDSFNLVFLKKSRELFSIKEII